MVSSNIPILGKTKGGEEIAKKKDQDGPGYSLDSGLATFRSFYTYWDSHQLFTIADVSMEDAALLPGAFICNNKIWQTM